MGLARGVVIQPTTFQLPKLQLPFEQMQAQIQGMQQEKDVYDTMKGMTPKFVEGDKPLVQAALGEVSKLVEGVSEGYASGKVSDAMRGIRQAKGVLSEMWKPTGVFGGVQAYYDEYQNALKEVDEFTKDFSDPSYKYVYKRLVQESVKDGSGLDLATGKRRSVGAPDMIKELDIIEDFTKKFPNWKDYADTTTSIRRYNNMYYIQETNEKVDTNEVANAWNNYIKSPEIQAHLRVQARYQADMAGETNQEMYRDMLLTESKNAITKTVDRVTKAEEGIKSNNVTLIKEAQRSLGVTADGIVGEKTLKALETQKQMADQQATRLKNNIKNIENIDIAELYKDRLENTMGQSIIEYFDMNKTTAKLIQDQAALANYKFGLQRRLDELRYQEANRTSFENTQTLGTLIQDIGGIYKGQKENYTKTFNSVLSDKKNPMLNQAVRSFSNGKRFGVFVPQFNQFIDEATVNGKLDGNKFKRLMEDAGYTAPEPGYKGEKLTLDQFVQNYNDSKIKKTDIESAADVIGSSYRSFADAAVGFNIAASKLDEGVNGIKWKDIHVRKPSAPSSTLIRSSFSLGNASLFSDSYTPDELKKEFMNGNKDVINAVSKAVGAKNLASMFALDKMYSFQGGPAAYFDKQQLELLQSNPQSITNKLNINTLSKEIRDKLGIKKQADGTFTIPDDIKFTNILNGGAFQNGRLNNYIDLTFTRGTGDKAVKHSITIPREGWNPAAYNESLLARGSSVLESDGSIRDEGAFKHLAVEMFNNDNSSLDISMTPGYMQAQLKNGKTTASTSIVNIGVPAQLTQGLMSDNGKIVHVYGLEKGNNKAIYNAMRESGGDLKEFNRILQDSGLSVGVAVGDAIGTYEIDSKGNKKPGGKVHVDFSKINNAMFEMQSTINTPNAYSTFTSELNVKRVPSQSLGVQYSASGLLNDEIYDNEQ